MLGFLIWVPQSSQSLVEAWTCMSQNKHKTETQKKKKKKSNDCTNPSSSHRLSFLSFYFQLVFVIVRFSCAVLIPTMLKWKGFSYNKQVWQTCQTCLTFCFCLKNKSDDLLQKLENFCIQKESSFLSWFYRCITFV